MFGVATAEEITVLPFSQGHVTHDQSRLDGCNTVAAVATNRHTCCKILTCFLDGYESLINSKNEISATVKTLLQLSPIILAFVYVLEYTYVFQYLVQFGVTPEQVGISEIKLLTRAAIFTVLLISLLGILPVMAGITISASTSIQNSRRIRPVLRKLNLIEQPKMMRRSDQAESARRAANRALAVRIGSTLSFAAAIGLTMLLMAPLGNPVAASTLITSVIIDVVLSVILFLGWRRRSTRYLAWASGLLFGIVLLGLTAFFGGTHKGSYTAEHGLVPDFIGALGVDILQVHPTWIDKQVMPQQYRGQDLLEIGSDEETVFLYDCWTAITYRIPLVDLTLNYPLYYNETTSATLKHLDCRLGSP